MLRADNLWKQYGKHEAIQGLSFNVPEGSAFALIGANGAGKTTTIKMLMNILRPSRGTATVLGVDSRRLSAAEFSRIGYVSENQEMPLALTVGEYLDYLRPYYAKWDRELERSLRSQLRLPADRRIGNLSHGMRMKMALACALPFHPELLVLDEPFNGLDALVRDELMEGMMALAGQMTIFISSHDLAEIDSFATDVAFIDEGRLLFEESMETLMSRFREVQLTLDGDASLPAVVPAEWLNLRATGSVVTFVDTRFAESAMSGRLSPYWTFDSARRDEASESPRYFHNTGARVEGERKPRSRGVPVIFHVIRKDWKLLWQVVLLVALVQCALNAMLFHIDHAATNKNPYGLLLQLMLFMTFLGRAVLIVMCVQQDAIPGERQDWLTRPVNRWNLMAAKLTFVLLFAQGPVLLADFLQAFAGGASFSRSLSSALIRSLFLLAIFTLPFVAFGALTRNLTEAVAGAVVFFLLVAGGQLLFVGLSEGRRILEVSPTTLTGLDWMPDALRLLVSVVAVAGILVLQYLWRETPISRIVLGAAALLCFAVRLLPWNMAYAMQEHMTPARGAGQRLTLAFASGQEPYRNLSGVAPDVLQGQFGGTKDADTVIYIPLDVEGLPAGSLLKNDRAEVRMVTARGEGFNLGVGGEFAPLPQGGMTRNIYSPVYVPDDLYKRFKGEPVRLEITYFSTLMQLEDAGTMAALGGQRDFASLGRCSSKMNQGETEIDVHCLEPGTIPLCTTAVLKDPRSGLANPARVSCLPSYAAVYPMLIPDGMSRYSAGLPFRDSNSVSSYPIQGKDLGQAEVEVRVFKAADHVRREVTIPSLRMEEWLPR